jgi:hypothetical protein
MNKMFNRLLMSLVLFGGLNAYASDCGDAAVAHWMLGNWQSKTAQSIVTENWLSAGGNSMTGLGTTVSLNGSVAGASFVESLGVIQMAGEVFYLAKPQQNKVPVAFKLVECSDNYLKFANPLHDFPQTIEYRLHSPNRMVALVVGGSKQFSIDFSLQVDDSVDRVSRVMAYAEAYDQRDLEQMLKLTAVNIRWMSVYDDKVAVETADQAALRGALQQHFSRSGLSKSSLSGIVSYGDFVSAIEKVTSIKNGKSHSACSLSVYQFDGDLIAAVWYYPAQGCESE